MSEKSINSYRDLQVWQKSIELVLTVYAQTESFPKSELYGLVMQMRRAAVSIPANIAEGTRRGTRRDYRQFLLYAYGSGSEIETFLELAKRLPFGKSVDFDKTERLLTEVMKMLNKLEPISKFHFGAAERNFGLRGFVSDSQYHRYSSSSDSPLATKLRPSARKRILRWALISALK